MNPYLKIFVMRCEEASSLASQGYDRLLTRPERIGLSLHTVGCFPCRRYCRQLKILHEALGRIGNVTSFDHSPSLPDEARDRIRQAIDQTYRNRRGE